MVVGPVDDCTFWYTTEYLTTNGSFNWHTRIGTFKFPSCVPLAAPAITSANNATFTVGSAGTFTVTTTGVPTATISETGALPSGVTFTDNGNGTATLAGTPAAGTGGTYPITITAANGVLPNASQGFTLTITTPSFTLSGTVSNTSAAPISGATVSAWNATTGAWTNAGVTDSSGLYSFTLPEGTYKLYIQPASGPYPARWFGGTSFATATSVALGAADLAQNLTVY